MEIEKYYFSQAGGWNSEPDAGLDSESTLILMFGSPEILQESDVPAIVERRYPHSTIIGCSTAGEILDDEMHRDTICLAIIKFAKTAIKAVAIDLSEAENSYDTGRSMGSALAADDLQAVLVFSDGLQTNGSELAKGLNDSLPPNVVIAGGLAADSDRFNETLVVGDGEYHSHQAAAVGLYGTNLKLGTGARGGWDIFGPERTVTSSEGGIVYEMDGSPALQLYKKYLGDLADELPATGLLFPISVKRNPNEEAVVRTIVAIDNEKQALIFAGDIPQGSRAQLMQASPERLVDGAEKAAEMARQQLDGAKPELGLVVSCFGRRLILLERTDDELEVVKSILGTECPLIGYYSYGELSSTTTVNCDLHNQTLTLLVMAET